MYGRDIYKVQKIIGMLLIITHSKYFMLRKHIIPKITFTDVVMKLPNHDLQILRNIKK